VREAEGALKDRPGLVLTWQDSNRRMAKSKKAFDPSEEFSTI
jgi:hypothetical protein